MAIKLKLKPSSFKDFLVCSDGTYITKNEFTICNEEDKNVAYYLYQRNDLLISPVKEEVEEPAQEEEKKSKKGKKKSNKKEKEKEEQVITEKGVNNENEIDLQETEQVDEVVESTEDETTEETEQRQN